MARDTQWRADGCSFPNSFVHYEIVPEIASDFGHIIALEPFVDRLSPERLRRLRHALAVTIGTEAILVTRDVCGLDFGEVREVTSWASMALVRQLLAEAELERKYE